MRTGPAPGLSDGLVGHAITLAAAAVARCL